MKEKLLANWRTLLLIVAIINLVAVDILLVRSGGEEIRSGKWEVGSGITEVGSETEVAVTPVILPTGVLDSCGSACQAKIAEEVAKAMATVSGERVVEKTTVVKELVPASSGEQAKVVYIPLVASASNTKTDWTDVAPSEFYFDLASYPGVKRVRFTGFLRAVHATGPVYVRLYDATNKRGVDNSDFSTSSDTFQRFESAALSIWRGNNLYRVQLRSPTATEAQLSEVKLKVEW